VPVGVGGRRVESSAVAAAAPILPLLPLCALALGLWWLPLHLAWDVSYGTFALCYLAAGALLFLRPVQSLVLAPLLGARRPTRHERAQLETAWRSVLQAARLPHRRYVLVVLPADELNAYACGGHLVVVTTFAIEALPRDELAGVLAHELSHHLGLHTVALTVAHWLSVPVLLLARIGFFLQNVAAAATTSFVSHSSALTAIGRVLSAALTAISWLFLSGLIAANALANVVGRESEFQADDRAVSMGFGRELSGALRRVSSVPTRAPRSWRERLAVTHPSARTRVAKIEATRRLLTDAAS
jgi:Zn-dependent protease with chaperone function